MLHLILGGAGSGKSTKLTEAISADVTAGKRAWLIIPEQQANLSERTMLPKLPPQAGLTFTIAGFSRLAKEVASHYAGAAIASADKGLCSLIMWKNLRELNGLMKEYNTASPRSDAKLTSLMLDTLSQLRAAGVSPLALERAAAHLPADAALRPKLEDVALIYAAYDNDLSAAFDGQSTDEVAGLAKALQEYRCFEGGHVYIDSFTSFTAEEYDVLREILLQADRVTLTLSYDTENPLSPAFDSIRDTLLRLHRLCEREHVLIQCEQLKENKRTASEELKLLERNLWNFSLRAEDLPTPAQTGSITMLRCTNIYAEAEATALHILDLVHHGTRYGAIAVVVRDSKTYRGVLDAAFERYGIPFYFSEKTTLSDKPLARFLLSALRGIAHGWQSQDILMMLKTGLCPVSMHDADLFEQYVATWQINGSAFAAPAWTRNPDGYTTTVTSRGEGILRAANQVRETLMTPLLRLHAEIGGGNTLPHLCAAMYQFMQHMDVPARCAALAEQELSAGYLKQAGETIRVYDSICIMLTQISARLPELSLDVEELITALSILFDETEIASVPSLHDSVTVGAADTLRVENVAVSFLLGLNEGDFPAATRDTGLLSESEKQQLQALGLALDGGQELQASGELLYVWRAMTKPSQQLFASALTLNIEGKEKPTSLAYNRLLFLFPYLKDRIRTFDLSMITDAPAIPQEEPLEPWEDDGEQSDAEESDASEVLLYEPVTPSEHDLPEELMGDYFGTTLRLSQARIDAFVKCPYSFYCKYLLALRERDTARVASSDSGTFIHYVLEHFVRRCMQSEGRFIPPAPDAVDPMATDIVNEYLRTVLNVSPTELRLIHTFRRLKATALAMLRDLLEELEHSSFVPRHVEFHIGDRPGDDIPSYEIPLQEGKRILLGGIVDRVDCYVRGDTTFVRVIDYKTGAREFSVADARRGIGLQLLIYLFSLCRSAQTSAAGMMYFSASTKDGKTVFSRNGLLLSDPVVLRAMHDTWSSHYFKGVKLGKDELFEGKGLADAQAFLSLEADVRETLCRIGQDMLCGRAARTPGEDACRFCPVRSSCPDAATTDAR